MPPQPSLCTPRWTYLGLRPRSEEPRAIADAEARAAVLAFRKEHEGRSACGSQRCIVGHIQGGLVDKAHIDSVCAAFLHGVEGAVEHFTVGHDIACRSFADNLVFTGGEGVAAIVEFVAIAIEDVGHFGSRSEHEAETLVPENLFDDVLQLESIRGEVETVVVCFAEAIGSEEYVDAEVAGVVRDFIDTGMGEMADDIGAVQARHGGF